MQPYRFNEPTLCDRNNRPTVGGWNRLVRIVRKSGDALTPVAEYTYDGLYRRVTKKVGIGNPVIHPYYSDRWKCLEEREDSGTDAVQQYVWGQRPNHRDELILRDRDTTANGTLDERLYALMDYFNCTSVVDTSGVVQERYGYSAFGVRRVMAADFSSRASSSFDWEFGFQGQFLDLESGYVNYGYRYYVPLIGRWVKRDPVGEVGGVNLNSMSVNNALNYVDFLGLDLILPDTVGTSSLAGNIQHIVTESAKKGTKLSNAEIESLGRGCIGICSYYQNRGILGFPYDDGLPESAPDTSCFIDYRSAKTYAEGMCADDKEPFIFIKQGNWRKHRGMENPKAGEPIVPTPSADGKIPNNSISGSGNRSDYNYISLVNGFAVDATSNIRNPDATFRSQDPDSATFPDYPQFMVCVTCKCRSPQGSDPKGKGLGG